LIVCQFDPHSSFSLGILSTSPCRRVTMRFSRIICSGGRRRRRRERRQRPTSGLCLAPRTRATFVNILSFAQFPFSRRDPMIIMVGIVPSEQGTKAREVGADLTNLPPVTKEYLIPAKGSDCVYKVISIDDYALSPQLSSSSSLDDSMRAIGPMRSVITNIFASFVKRRRESSWRRIILAGLARL